MTRYTSNHWGLYEVRPRESGDPLLVPWSGDPDPNEIGVHALAPELQRLRVSRPAVRRSWLQGGPGTAPHLRGQEPFVEVDWPTALELVAGELARVKREHGNTAIFGGSYGWSSAGRFHHAQSQVHRFLNSIGGYVAHIDSYSLGAGRVILPHVAMSLEASWTQGTSFDVMAAHTKLFVAFGGVPAKNAQISAGGVAFHRVRPGLRAMAEAGVRFINISPVRDNLDTGGDVEWIPIRPNTDTALMLALAHVLAREGLHDTGFLASHCHGYDRFAPSLFGDAPKTPEWAEAITGVPAARIERLAREMAATRTMINVAWSLQRASHGEQPFWMAVTLSAMLGQIGLPGGGFTLGYGPVNRVGNGHVNLAAGALPQGENKVRAFIPVARHADMLLHPGARFRYQGGEHTYPDIRLIYWAGGNPFHHHQDLTRLMRAWQKPESIIIHEQYWTAAAKFADVVLPATIALERDDLGYATGEGHIVAMRQAVPPHGAARDDFSIFADLAERLGVREAYTEGRDAQGWIAALYDITRRRAAEIDIDLPDFATFWEQGVIDLRAHDRPQVMLEGFRRDPVRHRLPTPSGRIEIFSEVIAGFELPDCPGHPTWMPPAEWHGNAAGRLHLLSDQPSRKLHSQLDASPYSAAGKIHGREPISLNPEDAAARGIADGDVVEVFNTRGTCLAAARLTADIMPGVARLSTGAWFDFDIQTGVEKHGNPNTLTRDAGASQLSQGCTAQTCLVEVRRAEGPVPRVTAHVPPVLVGQ
jgi:biotin/methionine sulfoxide reductase